VEPWTVRETTLNLDVLAQSESVFALSNGHVGPDQRARTHRPGRNVEERLSRLIALNGSGGGTRRRPSA
ncbi:hypothetical protein ACWC10_06545, partial [Streptomyces sp. NPDC001595]